MIAHINVYLKCFLSKIQNRVYTYIYTKIYSDAVPDFEEDDIFRLIVPVKPAEAPLPSDKNNKVVTEKMIISLLQDNAEYKTAELAEMLDISRKTVSNKLKNLKEKGIIERMGFDRKGYWNIYL